VVARRYAEVLSFPSGTTTVIASLVTAWVLAVPRRFRPFVVTVGTVLVGLECIAVVALQWHFPTDGLGGVVVGVGVILLIDGLLHVAARSNGAAGPGS
jgi:membrane-associated phospholipid phosphatase